MQLADRRGIVGLERMLRGILLTVVMLVLQTVQIVCPIGGIAIVYFIFRIGIRRLRTGVYLVGERQHAVLDLEQTLVVDTSVNGIPGTITVTIGDIVVQFVGSTGEGGQRIGRSVTLVLAAPKSEGHGYQPQCVDFIAGFHTA